MALEENTSMILMSLKCRRKRGKTKKNKDRQTENQGQPSQNKN